MKIFSFYSIFSTRFCQSLFLAHIRHIIHKLLIASSKSSKNTLMSHSLQADPGTVLYRVVLESWLTVGTHTMLPPATIIGSEKLVQPTQSLGSETFRAFSGPHPSGPELDDCDDGARLAVLKHSHHAGSDLPFCKISALFDLIMGRTRQCCEWKKNFLKEKCAHVVFWWPFYPEKMQQRTQQYVLKE